MKVKMKTGFRVYAAVLTVAVHLTIWAGLRTLTGWEESFPAVVSIILLAMWASPRIAMWALRPFILKYTEVVDD